MLWACSGAATSGGVFRKTVGKHWVTVLRLKPHAPVRRQRVVAGIGDWWPASARWWRQHALPDRCGDRNAPTTERLLKRQTLQSRENCLA